MTTEQIIAYEAGEMEQDEETQFIQGLINSGECWRLQGHYGREAMRMINAGLCMLGEVGHRDYYGNYVPSRTEVKSGTKGSEEYCRIMQSKGGQP